MSNVNCLIYLSINQLINLFIFGTALLKLNYNFYTNRSACIRHKACQYIVPDHLTCSYTHEQATNSTFNKHSMSWSRLHSLDFTVSVFCFYHYHFASSVSEKSLYVQEGILNSLYQAENEINLLHSKLKFFSFFQCSFLFLKLSLY